MHIHAPGTALNDQFANDWDGYLDVIESSQPPVVALGITDYCSIRTYTEFLARRDQAEIPSLQLVLPNVEFRLTPRTSDGKAINAHLLISSEDPTHAELIEEALGRLTVEIQEQPIPCTRKGLIQLGRLRLGSQADEEEAYKEGVNQFKVDVTPFLNWFESEGWLRKNSLLGIAGGKDGLAGLRKDDSFRQRHDELVRRADFLFSSQESDRRYYLGHHPSADPSEIRRIYGSLKPCLHGSDAHQLAEVLAPDLDRNCWIKAAPTFDGLKQVLYEPEGRVHIGTRHPSQTDPDRVIDRVRVREHAGWFDTPEVPLSEQLTCVIGEKGTGKTALADIVAAATGSWTPVSGAFLAKAESHLAGATAEVVWKSGRSSSVRVADLPQGRESEVMYLSQQFVERLCSGDLLADELVEEVERVIFDHIPESDRLNAGSFAELRSIRTEHLREARSEIREELVDLNQQIDNARSDLATLAARRETLGKTRAEIDRLEDRLKTLVSKEAEEIAEEVGRLQDRLALLQTEAGKAKAKITKAGGIRSKLERAEERFETWFADLRVELVEVGVPEIAVVSFRPDFAGDYKSVLDALEKRLREAVEDIEGPASGTPPADTIRGILAKLEEANKKLQLDEARKNTVKKLSRDVSRLRSQRDQLRADLERLAKLKTETLPSLQERRFSEYLRYFELIAQERAVLEELYQPLEAELGTRESGEADLQFEVATIVDVEAWAAQGEDMLDLRRSGTFSKRGALRDAARQLLAEPWEAGVADQIREGITQIISGILETDLTEILRSGYAARHVADWLFSVDHIRIDYTIMYKGVELKYLSPGTRGIVLLILYLGVDRLDDRPLIIDQPEENLDNASVYEVLVPYFRQAKHRRQIIIVTHNPNLVVNTDAEEVVVASAERRPSGLPVISYEYGPLEQQPFRPGKAVRDHVCDTLEGGRDAFWMRERRYEIQPSG